MMGSFRTRIAMVVVAAFILLCLVMGPVSGATLSVLFPWGNDGGSYSPGGFLILAEGPLVGNETSEPTIAEDPAEPTETAEPTESDAPADELQPDDPEAGGGPDFAVSDLRVPASVPEQSAYEVSFDVENLGDSYAGDIRWEVEFRGAILTASEYGTIEGLDTGQKVSVTVELMADVLVDARDEGSVSVVVDPDESAGDVDYGNNAAEEACAIVGKPEFYLTDLNAPESVYEGGTVEISLEIGNYGTAYEGDVDWNVVIRPDDHSGDDIVFTGSVQGLDEGETEWATALWNTAPGDAGEYVVSAAITTPDDESDDNEGICNVRVVTGGDLPDIALVDPRVPETLQPGVEFPVEFTVTNLGADYEGEIRYDIVYCNVRTGDDNWHGDVIPGLASGESVQITDYYTDYLEGDYWIDIWLDESNRIEELTEYNNNDRIVYHLSAGIAGLCAYGNGVPDTVPVVAGETVPISFSVVNIGEDYDGVIDWNIRIYNDDGDEDELTGTIQGLQWGWNEGKSVETSWEVPQGWEGEYDTVLDLNPDDRPEYVFSPWQNTGTFTIIGADSEDSENQSDSSTTEESTGDSDVCTSCAAGDGNDSDDDPADQESAAESDDSSASASADDDDTGGDDDTGVQDTGSDDDDTTVRSTADDDTPSAHGSHLVESTLSDVQEDVLAMEPKYAGMSSDTDNLTAVPLNNASNSSSNSSMVERAINETPEDARETDAWAALWDALAEGDIWSFLSNFYDLLMNGTVSCTAPFGAD
jgi:hypothetical protein